MIDILGIPYFGEEHNTIFKNIFETECTEHKQYTDMYDLILSESAKRTVVIIDNQWLTWLRDIQFNYRDNICVLPYYTYKLEPIEKNKRSSNNKGHLIISEDGTQFLIRHSYELHTMKISLDTVLTLYDIDENVKYTVGIDAWLNREFEPLELYRAYINSAYYEDDFLYGKHVGGYHYILRQFIGYKNVEKQRRDELKLPHIIGSSSLPEYRDVREYRREQLFGSSVIEDIVPYKYRRLNFDCLLYCIIHSNQLSNDTEFNRRYEKLKTTESILSYSPQPGLPPLILKSYWFGIGSYDNKRAIRRRVWRW